MISILESFLNTVTSVVNFIIHSIQSFFNLLTAIPKFTNYLFTVINTIIPDILKPFIILAIIVSVVLLILGRN